MNNLLFRYGDSVEIRPIYDDIDRVEFFNIIESGGIGGMFQGATCGISGMGQFYVEAIDGDQFYRLIQQWDDFYSADHRPHCPHHPPF